MTKSLLSQNSEIRNNSDLLFKFQLFYVFLFFILTQLLSAQASTEKEILYSDVTISVVGKGFIYSKDNTFNEQAFKNKSILTHTKLTKKDNQRTIKITAKETKTYSFKAKRHKKKKSRKSKLASKNRYGCKLDNSKKKPLSEHINNKEDQDQFFFGHSCGKNYFVPTDNNLSLLKYSIPEYFKLGSVCLIFLYNTHYFYNNKKSKLQIYPDSFSVRPPPVLA